jgi:D-Ala-D-Ala carboxypeptidase 3 (S13) family protein
VLDAGYYPSDLRIPGIEASDEAYDALNSALAVNFNTIHAVRKGKSVRSAEEQTPITPLAVSQFLARAPQGRSRISLTQDATIGLQYAGELIAAFIQRAGGSVKGKISTGAVPVGLEPVYVHRQSRPLSTILAGMLLGSNNYIANQVFLEIGGNRLGGPVSPGSRSRSRRSSSPSTGCPRPSNSRRAQGSAAAIASRPAALPSCYTPSSLTPPYCAAATAPCSRPARSPASAPWRAMPTPRSMAVCAS